MTKMKIDSMSFEEALSELEIVVKKLENGSENLENAINIYEYGDNLRKLCEKKLQEAQLKIEKISKNNDNSITKEEIDIE
jgi:exodeoxyribonuclease VII small subunit